jgi:hypothetical protein
MLLRRRARLFEVWQCPRARSDGCELTRRPSGNDAGSSIATHLESSIFVASIPGLVHVVRMHQIDNSHAGATPDITAPVRHYQMLSTR